MIEPSITTRFDRWALRTISGMRDFLSQYLYGLRDRSDKTTHDGPTVDNRMQGPIVWLGDLRSEKEARRKN
ncbi:MAG: hypothetical protein QOE02_5629 [Rhodospirillaceae bacterium]|jgi:hypothetical protein|nr:hypothetical protein [Rhodospirillaceae bacterium]